MNGGTDYALPDESNSRPFFLFSNHARIPRPQNRPCEMFNRKVKKGEEFFDFFPSSPLRYILFPASLAQSASKRP
jgi:hypothetical protein